MTIHELNRDQLAEVKAAYLVELANEGTFAEVVGVDYDAPSWDDMANADEIVPDDVIFEQHADTEFSEDDFFGYTLDRWEYEERGAELPWQYAK